MRVLSSAEVDKLSPSERIAYLKELAMMRQRDIEELEDWKRQEIAIAQELIKKAEDDVEDEFEEQLKILWAQRREQEGERSELESLADEAQQSEEEKGVPKPPAVEYQSNEPSSAYRADQSESPFKYDSGSADKQVRHDDDEGPRTWYKS